MQSRQKACPQLVTPPVSRSTSSMQIEQSSAPPGSIMAAARLG